MPIKPGNFSKTKSPKKSTPFKPSTSNVSIISSSLYSGVRSAQLAIQNPASAFSNYSKIRDDLDSITGSDDVRIQYYPWESKYKQIYTREKIKKSMTKDSYQDKKYVIINANESITTKEECEPLLLPFDAIRINKPVIHQKENITVPNVVRQVRYYNVTQSERFLPPVPTKQPSISELQVETKTPLPMIGTKKKKKNSVTKIPLSDRIKLRNNATVIRRPPRQFPRKQIHETITPLAVFA